MTRGVLAALERALGHGYPFTQAELEGITELTVVGTGEIGSLTGCSNLQYLRIVGSEFQDIRYLKKLRQLRRLEIYASLFPIEALSLCKGLEELEIIACGVEQVNFFAELPELRRVVLQANPWDGPTRRKLPEIERQPDRLLHLCPQAEWKQAHALWQKAGLTGGMLGGWRPLVVRPGIARHTSNAFDALEIDLDTVDGLLDEQGRSLGRVFEDRSGWTLAPDLGQWAAAREVGHAGTARDWIAAAPLSEPDREALRRFLARFSGVVWYRQTDLVLDRKQRKPGEGFPAALRAHRATLAGWFPHLQPWQVPFRFGGLALSRDLPGPVGRPTSFFLQQNDGGEETFRHALKQGGYVIIGRGVEERSIQLAFRTTDHRVYQFDEEMVAMAARNGEPIEDLTYPVFASLAAMLDHIVELGPETVGWIQAKPEAAGSP